MDVNTNPVNNTTVEVKPKKKINKTTIIILCVAIVLVIACAIIIPIVISNYNKKLQKEREDAFTSLAQTYYTRYMSGVVGVDEATITLEDINKANTEMDAELDTSILDTCDASSSVVYTLDQSGTIVDTKMTLNCK